MNEQEPLSAQLMRIIQDREDAIDLLRDQIRALNSELVRVKQKLKNWEERND